MKKLLKRLLITQHNEIEGTKRLNPYNPLSYLAFILGFIYVYFTALISTTIEILKEISFDYNPFKWH